VIDIDIVFTLGIRTTSTGGTGGVKPNESAFFENPPDFVLRIGEN
jgi:hypothetical protein